MLSIKYPSNSALQYTAAKLGSAFWQKVLKLTSGGKHYLVAIDSTGLPRTNPSYHYLRRIDGKIPAVPVKLSTAFDTQKKKFCAGRTRVFSAHDLNGVQPLVKHSDPKIVVVDKAYSSEKLYEFTTDRNILLMIPKKSNTKRGFYRSKAQKRFRLQTYHRRELGESGNSSIKHKYEHSVSSKTVRTICTEVMGRLACHNIFFWLNQLLGQSPKSHKIYKCTMME